MATALMSAKLILFLKLLREDSSALLSCTSPHIRHRLTPEDTANDDPHQRFSIREWRVYQRAGGRVHRVSIVRPRAKRKGTCYHGGRQ
jgi:hypothetical protein